MWTLGAIAKALNVPCATPEVVITGEVVTDSRLVTPGSLFIARVGENQDGHQYLQAAKEKGAVAAFVQDADAGEAAGLPYLCFPDTSLALGRFARAHLAGLRQQENPPLVIGITGSAGKTSTKDLLAALLSTQGETIAPERSFNNEVGLPLTVLKARKSTRYLVLEMGASASGELSYLCEIAPLDMAILLMVGHAHLEGFGSVRALARAKSELLGGLRNFPESLGFKTTEYGLIKQYFAEDTPLDSLAEAASSPIVKGKECLEKSLAVLNFNDVNLAMLASGEQIYGFSINLDYAVRKTAQVWASDVELNTAGQVSFTLHTPERALPVTLALVGKHHIANALAVATAGYALGIDLESIGHILEHTGARSAHRMAVSTIADEVLLIDDSYNANLDSLKAALDALAELGRSRPGRNIAVIGEMLELGEYSKEHHEKVGEYALETGCQQIVAVGKEAKHIYEKYPDRVHYFETALAALPWLKAELSPGDTLLLKGSNGSKVWQLAEALNDEEGKN